MPEEPPQQEAPPSPEAIAKREKSLVKRLKTTLDAIGSITRYTDEEQALPIADKTFLSLKRAFTLAKEHFLAKARKGAKWSFVISETVAVTLFGVGGGALSLANYLQQELANDLPNIQGDPEVIAESVEKIQAFIDQLRLVGTGAVADAAVVQTDALIVLALYLWLKKQDSK
ncbi:MAG: hypothetical protein KBD05_02455 [Candidatus Pacebacteria bacterium]|nr:hypothetical protein [Candidatus Paceibacterota bacterium]